MGEGTGGRSRWGDGGGCERRGLAGARPRGVRVCRAAVAAAVGAVLVPVLAVGFGVRVNTSGSLPVGVYRLAGMGGGPVVRGTLVLLCPPVGAARLARRRGYLPAGGCPGGVEPLGKMVVAVVGDWVEMSERGLRVNGVAMPESRGRRVDSAGRAVPWAFSGRRRMGRGEAWVYAPHARSFDSRVFGPVPVGSVLGRLEAVLAGRSRRLAETAAAVGRIGLVAGSSRRLAETAAVGRIGARGGEQAAACGDGGGGGQRGGEARAGACRKQPATCGDGGGGGQDGRSWRLNAEGL